MVLLGNFITAVGFFSSPVFADIVIIFLIVVTMILSAVSGMLAKKASKDGNKSLMAIACVITTFALVMTIVMAVMVFIFPEFRL